MPNLFSRLLLAGVLVAAAACGSSETPEPDAGAAIPDAGDTQPDAGATPDAGETTPDAGDTQPDAGETPDGGGDPFEAPDAPPVTIEGNFWGTCQLVSGKVSCTGDNLGTRWREFPGTYVELAENSFVCALSTDGHITCTGTPEGQTDRTPTGGGYRRVAACGSHVCAINSARGIECWTYPDLEGDATVAATPTRTDAIDLSCGYGFSCAAFKDGAAQCWGGTAKDFGSHRYVGVFGYNGGHAYAIRDDGQVDWVNTMAPTDWRVKSLAGNFSGLCGLQLDGTVACTGLLAADAPTGTFTEISNGFRHVCARASGSGLLRCWGPDNVVFQAKTALSGATKAVLNGQFLAILGADDDVWTSRTDFAAYARAPAGWQSLAGLDAGELTCGLDGTGAPVCWAPDWLPWTAPPVGTTFTSISVGHLGACGLKADGKPVCFGHESVVLPPDEAFVEVAAAHPGACGRKVDGSVTCWGFSGVPTSPADRFTQLSGANTTMCGLRTDGTIKCWGEMNDAFSAAIPTGSFTQVDVGGAGACALASTGAVTCWGGNAIAPAPAGTFDRVWVGGGAACGRRTNGKLSCWGGVGYESQ